MGTVRFGKYNLCSLVISISAHVREMLECYERIFDGISYCINV